MFLQFPEAPTGSYSFHSERFRKSYGIFRNRYDPGAGLNASRQTLEAPARTLTSPQWPCTLLRPWEPRWRNR